VAKRLAGTTVDRRNGMRHELAGRPARLARFPLPDRRTRDRLTRTAWDAWWSDPVSEAWTVGDKPILIELADAYDRRVRALRKAEEDPIVAGRNDQPVASPWYAIAEHAYAAVQDAYRQLGFGALNRSRLGLMILAEQRTLADLNAGFDLKEYGDEPDPRLADPALVIGTVIKPDPRDPA
jgi:hypothetical protein